MVAATARLAEVRARKFYVWMAAVCVLAAFGGFAATYWLQLAAGTFVGPPILHLHGLVFTAWPLFLLSQATLAANGRMQDHRALGVAGVSLATAMIFLGLTVAIRGLNEKLALGYGDAERSFMMLPLGSITLFAGFVIAAVANVSRPEWHKRFMLAATCAVLMAAAGRVGFLLATHGGGPGMRPGRGPPVSPDLGMTDAILVSTLLLVGMAYDWRTRGRPHPAYLIALGAILTVGFVGPFVARTQAWYAAMDALATLGR